MPYAAEDIERIIEPAARKYGAARVRAFWPYARREAAEESGMDFLIERGKTGWYSMPGGFCGELAMALGTEIDLAAAGSDDRDFLMEIAKDEVLIYDREI
ncbi:MAG: nucleotidyltransferase [Deltaproteobacteria bacterium]|jgi:predicted nucleotidyltransferase|nr:nucleotidyltransferase [Deltaproteobacteria bacterium]